MQNFLNKHQEAITGTISTFDRLIFKGHQRYDNKITHAADLAATKALCKKFAHRKWPCVLNAFARRVNPHLGMISRAGFGGYYWVIDQSEYATDVLFRDRASLEALFPALVELAMTAFSADDVLRFLGRKLHGNPATAG